MYDLAISYKNSSVTIVRDVSSHGIAGKFFYFVKQGVTYIDVDEVTYFGPALQEGIDTYTVVKN